MPSIAVVRAGAILGAVHQLRQPLVEHLHHQRGLAAAADAGDRDELAQRDAHVDVLEVVLARAADDQVVAVALAPLLRARRCAARRAGSGRSGCPGSG